MSKEFPVSGSILDQLAKMDAEKGTDATTPAASPAAVPTNDKDEAGMIVLSDLMEVKWNGHYIGHSFSTPSNTLSPLQITREVLRLAIYEAKVSTATPENLRITQEFIKTEAPDDKYPYFMSYLAVVCQIASKTILMRRYPDMPETAFNVFMRRSSQELVSLLGWMLCMYDWKGNDPTTNAAVPGNSFPYSREEMERYYMEWAQDRLKKMSPEDTDEARKHYADTIAEYPRVQAYRAAEVGLIGYEEIGEIEGQCPCWKCRENRAPIVAAQQEAERKARLEAWKSKAQDRKNKGK